MVIYSYSYSYFHFIFIQQNKSLENIGAVLSLKYDLWKTSSAAISSICWQTQSPKHTPSRQQCSFSFLLQVCSSKKQQLPSQVHRLCPIPVYGVNQISKILTMKMIMRRWKWRKSSCLVRVPDIPFTQQRRSQPTHLPHLPHTPHILRLPCDDSQRKKTLPEAQRTQGIASLTWVISPAQN